METDKTRRDFCRQAVFSLPDGSALTVAGVDLNSHKRNFEINQVPIWVRTGTLTHFDKFRGLSLVSCFLSPL